MVPSAVLRHAELFCWDILPFVSRTFAIGIRRLTGNLGLAVLSSYLLCRIADSIEDNASASPELKSQLLEEFLCYLKQPERYSEFLLRVRQLKSDHNTERLLHHTDLVLLVYRQLPQVFRDIILYWVAEMVKGMKLFILRYPAGIRIQTLPEFQEYCYYVAGTVGHLLTDLWAQHYPKLGKTTLKNLKDRSQAFGEGLQALNILKDYKEDVHTENSIFIPQSFLISQGSSHDRLLLPEFQRQTQQALLPLFDLTWGNLEDGFEYLQALPRGAIQARMFCSLPLLFGVATFRELRSEHRNKISRSEVRSIVVANYVSVMSNRLLEFFKNYLSKKPLLFVI